MIYLNLCRCTYCRFAQMLAPQRFYALTQRDVVQFALFRCEDCGGVAAVPRSDFLRALARGTPNTHLRIRRLTLLH